MFNKLINYLNRIADRFFKQVRSYKVIPYDLEEDKYEILNNKVSDHRVFLSYAFKDYLYAFVYLYICISMEFFCMLIFFSVEN